MKKFIGDVHGHFQELKDILATTDKNTQVILAGDIGLGFAKHLDEAFPAQENLWFIRGNHDNPEVCRETSGYLGDFGYNEKLDIFFVSGAWSIDRNMRMEGLDWWRDEELSALQSCDAIDLYEQTKPRVVVSHDCPFFLYEKLIAHDCRRNSTATLLAEMWEIHQPELWIFGHHHKPLICTVQKTKFRGLGCLPDNIATT